MGEVRTEHKDTVVTIEFVDERWNVVLRVGRDSDMLLEDHRRALLELSPDPRAVATHAPALVQMTQRVGDPAGTVLGDQHVQPGEAPEEIVEDQGGEGVDDGTFAVDVHPLPSRHVPGGRVGVVAPGR